MNEIRIAIISPIAVFAVITGLFYLIKIFWRHKATFRDFLNVTCTVGAILSGIALAGTYGWAIWYWYSTGYDPNQAPLAWIFLYGPASFALGEVAGFAVWIKRQLNN